jgi:DNA (cytosine-5)-methyltransferase 1
MVIRYFLIRLTALTDIRIPDSESDLETITVNSREASATPSKPTANDGKSRAHKARPSNDISLPDVAIQRYKIGTGFVIKPGDTVELKDHSNQDEGAMHSGDFLRIKSIIMNMETDEVRLRGWRMRRTKYLGQIFDCEYDKKAGLKTCTDSS